jgi:hypothetical protein
MHRRMVRHGMDGVSDMIGRSRRATIVAAMLLALALPAQAQDSTSDVRFDGVGFSFDHALGRSVNITRVPAIPVGETQVGEAPPAHLVFSLYGRRAESARIPRIWDAPGTVRAYATTALEGYPLASQQLTRLQQLLSDRPEPSSLEAITDNATTELPYLPIEEAAQAIAARIQYIDTPELSGIAYVTGFRQDVFPFARDDFWYTFQGVSTDGRWYVSVNWVLRADMFPRRVSQADARRAGSSARRWERYITRSVATLDAAEPTAFRPSLETLDALVRSIDFESVVAASPSPGATASPTDAPGASEGPPSSSAAPPSPSAAPASPSTAP